MKFAFFSHVQWPETKNPDQAYCEVLEQVQYAEELGFQSAWFAEHHFTRYGLAPSPLMLATYIASKTSKIRLGTAVTILPFHDPVVLAEEVAMLDVLSGGRVDLGVGRGEPHPNYWASMNVRREDSEGRFGEVMDLLPQLWTTPGVSHQGEFHTLNNVTLVPTPVQTPHPPIYMGVSYNGNRPREAVVRGHGIISGVVLDIAEHLKMRNVYDATAVELGKDLSAYSCPLFLHTMVAPTKRQAYEDAHEGLTWMYQMIDFRRTLVKGSDIAYDFLGFARERTDFSYGYQQVIQKKALLGTPKEVASRLKTLHDEGGVGYYGCDFTFGGIRHAKVMRSLELFAKEVMPRLE